MPSFLKVTAANLESTHSVFGGHMQSISGVPAACFRLYSQRGFGAVFNVFPLIPSACFLVIRNEFLELVSRERRIRLQVWLRLILGLHASVFLVGASDLWEELGIRRRYQGFGEDPRCRS